MCKQLFFKVSIVSFVISFCMAYKYVHNVGVGGKGTTLLPKSGRYDSVVLFFHGLGDSSSGWASSMPSFHLENTKFILPDAPSRPITLNGGFQMPGWSDISGLEETSPEDRAGFDESMDRIRLIIDDEMKNHDIDSKRIIIGGFSQGGALALHTALRSTYKLGGCVALSSWLPFRSDFTNVDNTALTTEAAHLPIFQCHGTDDVVVHYKWGHHTHVLLKEMIPHSKLMTITGMGHSSHPSEMVAVGEFMKSILKVES